MHYRDILDAQTRMIERKPWSAFVDKSDCTVKIGVDISKESDITHSMLLKKAIKMAESLQEIHRMASAGCPQNDDCEDYMEGISILAQV